MNYFRNVQKLAGGVISFILCCLFMIAIPLRAQEIFPDNPVEPSDRWITYSSNDLFLINEEPAPRGTVVQVFDPDGVLCGIIVTEERGRFGPMRVYGDDPGTEVDEGAEPGDPLTLKVNGVEAVPEEPEKLVWAEQEERILLDISITGPTVSVSQPVLDLGTVRAGTTIDQNLTIENTGLEELRIDSITVLPGALNPAFTFNPEESRIGVDNQLEVQASFNSRDIQGDIRGVLLVYSNALNWMPTQLNRLEKSAPYDLDYDITDIPYLVPFSATVESGVIPSDQWISFYSEVNTTLDGEPVQPGTVINAYDQSGTIAGSDTVEYPGGYGMKVYRDNPETRVDEGLEEGEVIEFRIDGLPATPVNGVTPTWTLENEHSSLPLRATSNNPPEVVQPVEDQEMDVTDQAITLNLENYFLDPEGGPLTFSAMAEIPSVAAVEVSGSTLTIEAQSPGTTTVGVWAEDDQGGTTQRSFSVTVTDSPPAAPGNLFGYQSADTLITSWSPSEAPDLQGYKLYRSTESGFSVNEQSLLTDTLTTSSFHDLEVEGEQFYYYRVAAYDTAGNQSESSDEISVYFDNTPPSAPGSVTAEKFDLGVRIDWEAVEAADFASYQLYRGRDAEFLLNQQTLLAGGLKSAHFSDTLGAVQGRFYYKVTSLDTTGNESEASELLAVEYDKNPPEAPLGLEGEITGDGILLTWQPVNTEDHHHYEVFKLPEPDSGLNDAEHLTSTQDTTASYSVAGSAGTHYYTVTAVDTAGNASTPAEVVDIQFDQEAPPVTQNLKTTVTDTGVVLQWDEAVSDDLAEYRVYRSDTESIEQTVDFLLADEITDTLFTDRPGERESYLYYAVTSVDTVGNESNLSSIQRVYVDNIPPRAPEITDIEWEETGLRVEWSPVEKGDLHSYALYRNTTAGEFEKSQLLEDSLSATTFLDETVTGGTTYYYSITATDTLGNESPWSEAASKSYINEWSHIYEPGWHLVSRPIAVADSAVETLFPGVDPQTLYAYDGSYRPDSVVAVGAGYWLRIDEPTEVMMKGPPVEQISVPLKTGWNLIGAPVDSVLDLAMVQDPGNIIIDGTYQGYAGAYQAVEKLVPGRGYYVRAAEPGTIVVGAGRKTKEREKVDRETVAVSEVTDRFDRLTFGSGEVTQHLYMGGSLSGDWSKRNFSLPPAPPQPVLDVRFDGDYRLAEKDSVLIELKAGKYPVSVELNHSQHAGTYELKLFRKGQQTETRTLAAGDVRYINDPVDYIALFPLSDNQQAVPEQVELKPNYPNPFNPSTTIRYAIPEALKVTLEVYDLLGQKVATLVDKEQSAGNYQIPFNASDLSSGLYFVQIRAGSYQEVQKITLVK
ncbi:T9SS type A sorting domain-containing protein [Halalkalibaculum sp. DA3122]|uniref:T9SS type A sorting domain-containing protein n=1 Tax=Halalkalibaculum sp. DA3122 TaxID=3373607 RepID=UPI0037540FB5